MAGLETVYAIHSFEAENQDEIGFSAGEPIVVVEKDEGYNDGWWQVSLHSNTIPMHAACSLHSRVVMYVAMLACSQ